VFQKLRMCFSAFLTPFSNMSVIFLYKAASIFGCHSDVICRCRHATEMHKTGQKHEGTRLILILIFATTRTGSRLDISNPSSYSVRKHSYSAEEWHKLHRYGVFLYIFPKWKPQFRVHPSWPFCDFLLLSQQNFSVCVIPLCFCTGDVTGDNRVWNCNGSIILR
jgi:hypothetical protein